MDSTAYLSNERDIIAFAAKGRTVRFRGPYSLVRIAEVTQWDNGYMTVNAYYSQQDEPVEDYIDLVPILEDLYIDPQKFLSNIRTVEVREYDR